MLEQDEIKNYLEKINEDISVEVINEASLTSIASCVRNLLEDQGCCEPSSSQWLKLHSPLHVKSFKITDTTFFHNIISVINGYSTVHNDLVEKITKNILKKYPLLDEEFFSFSKTRELGVRKYLIKKCKLVSTSPKIFEIIAREDKEVHKNDVILFSSESLQCFSTYELFIVYMENGLNQEYFFSVSSERYFNDTLYFQSELLRNIREEAKNSSRTILHQILIDNKLSDILDEFHNVMGIEKKWPEEKYENRQPMKFVQSIFSNDKYNMKRLKYTNETKYYPFFLDPLVSSSPVTSIPKVIVYKMFEYYQIPDGRVYSWTKDLEINELLNEKDLLIMPNPDDKKFVQNILGEPYSKKKIRTMQSHISTVENINVLGKIKTISEKSKLLIAPAGHGKSHWIKENILNSEKNIALYTPTTKAQEVYKNFKNKNNISIQNIQKISKGNGKFNTEYEVFIFDEISMYDFKDWNAISLLFNKEIYLVGDEMQLQPIDGKNLSKYFKHFKDNFVNLDNNWRIGSSDHKNELKELFSDLRAGKLSFKKRNYKKLFYGYSKYSEIFNILSDEKYREYKILVHKNQGVISVKNLNRIIHNRKKEIFEIGDEIIFNEFLENFNVSEKIYNGKKTTIKNIVEGTNTGVIDYFFEGGLSIEAEPGTEPFDISKVMTVHKSQGQTIKDVIVIIDSEKIDYHWIYTAVSRTSHNIKVFIKNDMIGNHNDTPMKITKHLKNLV